MTNRMCPSLPCEFEPLHKLCEKIGVNEGNEWMYMGAWPGNRIHTFKHYTTRNHLQLDILGNLYAIEVKGDDRFFTHIEDERTAYDQALVF